MGKGKSITLSPLQVQLRLLTLAVIFLFLYCLVLTLAPAARSRTWDVVYNWSHWIGFGIWCVSFTLLVHQMKFFLPDADTFVLPLVALLSGWGLITIWRLLPGFGLRQSVWLLLSSLVMMVGLRFASGLFILRRYKYILLTAGILLTALTLIVGVNPEGSGLSLWLGCCGIYLQPTEPLKLIFLIYLSAYLSDRIPLRIGFIPLIAPTVIVTSLALLILVVQRDLGTAFIFIFIYAFTLFISSGKKRVLFISLAGLVVAGVAGYFLFDVVRLRVEAWLNPWLDPSGRSFQIVQSLMAIANGGLGGRGLGLGSPGLVPVAISDFIFTSIAEETGLVGSIALLAAIAVLISRGLLIAIKAPDNFRRLLAASLTACLGVQSILIIGGNIRFLPLTGVTLPFVSYGGSSLLTSFISILLLLHISNIGEGKAAPLPHPHPYLISGAFFGFAFLGLALVTSWWAFWRGPDLLTRTDNARRSIADRYVLRGALLDRNETPINLTTGTSGKYKRIYAYPDLSSVAGYTNPTYGQAGLEASLDPYLRGLRGNPASLIWIDHLLYGQPPPGLDVILSLDLGLQTCADALLGQRQGAVVLINADTGEILVMASHPVFDANQLDENGSSLLSDPTSPLLNRAAQGSYPFSEGFGPFLLASGLGNQPSNDELAGLISALGFTSVPDIPLPVAAVTTTAENLHISPLQMSLAVAALSNGGVRPAAVLATGVRTPSEGWVFLPAQGESSLIFLPEEIEMATGFYAIESTSFWQSTSIEKDSSGSFTWSIAGTLPNWQGTKVVVAVLLEEDYPALAGYIGIKMLQAAITP